MGRKITYRGRVVHANNRAAIQSAKVTLDAQEHSAISHTDSEGVYQFNIELQGNRMAAHIAVDAEGYEKDERNITLTEHGDLEDIRLRPTKTSRPQEPSSWITRVIVPVLVALIGAVACWQFFLPPRIPGPGPTSLPVDQTPPPSSIIDRCQILASEIIIGSLIIAPDQSIPISIRVDIPPKPIQYKWAAVYGKVNPSIATDTKQVTYTAPSIPTDDTIFVDLTTLNCIPTRRSRSISVINRATAPGSISAPIPTNTPVIVIPPSAIVYTGRIVDATTLKPIFRAQATLTGQGTPLITFTDSNGIFAFEFIRFNKVAHLYIEAPNYIDFDLIVLPSENVIEDIRLQPRP